MPEWDYRPIYYDPEKEKRKQRLQNLHAQKTGKEGEENSETADTTYHTGLHRGSFREARKNTATGARRTSRLAFWIALLAMLIFCFYFLL